MTEMSFPRTEYRPTIGVSDTKDTVVESRGASCPPNDGVFQTHLSGASPPSSFPVKKSFLYDGIFIQMGPRVLPSFVTNSFLSSVTLSC